MLGWFGKAATVTAEAAVTIAFGAISAFVTAFDFLKICDFFSPIEPWDSGGPAFALGLIIIGLVMPTGFMAGCVLASIVWIELAGS